MSLLGSGSGKTSGDVDSDIYFNPFAGSSQSSFSSAVKPKDASVATRPMFRRRGSDSNALRRARNDHDPWAQDDSSPFGTVHSRSRTLDAVVGNSSSSAKSHPLASRTSTSGAGSSLSSFAETRPRLKRLLSDLEPAPSRNSHSNEDEQESDARRLNNSALKERVVIVHEITQKDSLPGVSLKYGISLADLRKANQLWPSDPIHLRKVLYIPLDKSHKAKELVLSQLDSSNSGAIPHDPDGAVPSSSHGDKYTPSLPSSSTLTIRRVPVSQLSFFPPSSTSSVHSPSIISRSRTLPRTASGTPRRDPIPFEVTPSSSSSVHSASTSSSLPSTSAFASALQAPPSPTPPRAPMPSLTSLFGALPIGRISFDSGVSTPSQTSEDQDHEMGDVSRSSPSRNARQRTLGRQTDYPNALGLRTPPRQPSHVDGVELSPFSSPNGLAAIVNNKSSRVLEIPRSQKPIQYLSPERNSTVPDLVRTSQLEPTPVMQLPLKSRKVPHS